MSSSDFDDTSDEHFSDEDSDFGDESVKSKPAAKPKSKAKPKKATAKKAEPKKAQPKPKSTPKEPATKRKTDVPSQPAEPAPKKRKAEPKPKVVPEPKMDAAALEESARRKAAAMDAKIVGREMPMGSSEKCKALVSLNGLDVVKKGRDSKTKYLFVLPFTLTPTATGAVGRLSKMDTSNPVLYIAFPTGRLKLAGTLVHPKSRLLLIKPKAGQALCEKVFESMLVFGAAVWVGTAEENPEELELPMPEAIKQMQKPVQSTLDFSKAAEIAPVADEPSAVDSGRRSARMVKSVSYIEKGEDDMGDDKGSSSSE